METYRVPARSWILACDGAKALIFRADRRPDEPHVKLIEHYAHEAPPTHELGADRPGRVNESEGFARSSVEQTDFHLQEEERFLEKIAHRLDRAADERALSHLVVVAPPRALGILRQKMSARLTNLILNEIHSDLTQFSASEIANRFVVTPPT